MCLCYWLENKMINLITYNVVSNVLKTTQTTAKGQQLIYFPYYSYISSVTVHMGTVNLKSLSLNNKKQQQQHSTTVKQYSYNAVLIP